MSYVPIFHLTIPAVWVSVLLAAAAASIFTHFVLQEKTDEWFWNAVTLYIVLWKISYIPFNFQHFVDMPLSILYFNGGLYGHFLGIASVFFYLVGVHLKDFTKSKQFMFAWLLFVLSYQTLLQIFEQQFIEASFHGFLLLISIVSIRTFVRRLDVPMRLLLTALFMLELLIISIFHSLFSWSMATFVIGAIVTIVFYKRYEKKGTSL